MRAAAENGHPDAQFILGKFYYQAHIVEKNVEETIKWFRCAAEQGHCEAQFYLWAFYDAGEGVERNAEEAQKWLLLAAEQGHEKAIELLEEENDK